MSPEGTAESIPQIPLLSVLEIKIPCHPCGVTKKSRATFSERAASPDLSGPIQNPNAGQPLNGDRLASVPPVPSVPVLLAAKTP